MPGKHNYQEKISRTREQNKKERFSIRKLTVGAASVLLGFSFLMGNNQQTVKADTAVDQTSISKQIDKQTTDTDQVAKDKDVKVEPKLSTFSGLQSFLYTKTADVPTEDADQISATTDVNSDNDAANEETTTDTAIATGESTETATAAANLQTQVDSGQAVVDSTDFANAEAAKQTALTTAIKAGQDLLTKYQAQEDLTTNTNTSTTTVASPITVAELSAASDQIAQSLRELKDVVSGGTDTAASTDNTWIDGDCLLVYDTDNQTLHVKAGEKGNTLVGGGAKDPISNIVNDNVAYFSIEKLVFDDNVVLPADASYIFSDLPGLKEIDGLDKVDTSNVTNMAGMFSNDYNLTSLDLSHFNTRNVTDMSFMFGGKISSLKNLDLSSFDTSNVTNMARMFAGDNSLTSLDLSSFDTSNVTDMSNMFAYECNLTSLDLSNLDTSSVTNMEEMFAGDTSLINLDLSNFDTSNVTNMHDMFGDDSSLTSLDLNDFDTSNVTDMSWMFVDNYSLTDLDLSNFDTNKVTDMARMFEGDSSLTSLNLSNFNTSNVTDMSWMFADNSSLISLDLSNFDTQNITESMPLNMNKTYFSSGNYEMLYNTGNPNRFVLNLGHNRLYSDSGIGSNHQYIQAIGKGTEEYPQGKIYTSQELEDLYNQPAEDCPVETYVMTNEKPETQSWLDGDCVLTYDKTDSSVHVHAGSQGNTLAAGKENASLLQSGGIVEKIVFEDNVSLPADASYAFSEIYGLKEIDGLDKVDTSNVTNMAGMFSNNDNLTSLNLSHFDTSNVTDMSFMFGGKDSPFKNLDLSSFDTSNVINMNAMFEGDYSLTSLDLSNFDTSNVTDMSAMFSGDYSLTSLDLSNFDTSNVTDMSYMFAENHSLTSLDLSNFDTSNVTNMVEMFAYDTNLKFLDISSFKTNDGTITKGIFINVGNPDHFVLKLGHTKLDLFYGLDYNYIRAVGKGTERYPQGKIYTKQELEVLYNQPAEDCPVETYVMTSTEPIDGWVDGDCVLIYDKEDKSLHVKAGEKGNTLGIGGKNNSFSYIVNGQVADSLDEQHPIEKLVFDDNVILPADASYKFSNLKNLKEIDGLDKVDTSSVLDMSNLFAQTGADNSGLTTLDLSNFDTSQVTDMNHMFYHMDNVQDLDVRDFDTSNVTDMRSMFAGDEDLDNLDLSHFNTSNVEDMNSMFFGDQNLTSLDLSNFDTSKVTDMSYMFGVGAYGASSLVSLDLSNFDTSSVTDMASMFFGANHLKNLDLSSFDTSEVEDMNHMFYGDSNLTTLDLSNFDTNRVTDMASMFENDSNLKTLDLSNFDTSNVSDLSQMFENDSNLKSLDLRNFNTQKARYKTTDMLLNTGDAKYFILQLGHTRLYGDSQVGAGKGQIQTTSGKTYTSSELEDLYNQKPNSCPVATYVMTK